MISKTVRSLVRYARAASKIARKKAKPTARRILNESIKLERMMESEAKKILGDKKKKRRN